MKGRTVLLDHIGDREAAALMVDGRLDDLYIAADAPPPGTVYRAKPDRPVKGQGGIFLTTPDGQAFLRDIKGISPGQPLLVQVTGYAEPGKALPVTRRVLYKSRFAIVTPDAPGLNVSRSIRDEEERVRLTDLAEEAMAGSPFGLILRSAAAGADDEEVVADIADMRAIADRVAGDASREVETLVEGDGPHALAWREWSAPAEVVTEPGCFETHGALDAIDAARRPSEPLPGGGTMYVEATRALVAVDVNTGRDTSPAAGTRANIACARALPRALRIRGLGGQITLDLAPMPKKDRGPFESALRSAFRADPDETSLAGWTPLGHYELQRKRARLPLTEVLP